MRVMPAMTEAAFQQQVTDLAELTGWAWAHFRPAMTSNGWRTPVSGPIGAGFPDLVLVRARDKRLIFAELKAARGPLSEVQESTLATLREVAEVHVWRPADFDAIAEVLR